MELCTEMALRCCLLTPFSSGLQLGSECSAGGWSSGCTVMVGAALGMPDLVGGCEQAGD